MISKNSLEIKKKFDSESSPANFMTITMVILIDGKEGIDGEVKVFNNKGELCGIKNNPIKFQLNNKLIYGITIYGNEEQENKKLNFLFSDKNGKSYDLLANNDIVFNNKEILGNAINPIILKNSHNMISVTE